MIRFTIAALCLFTGNRLLYCFKLSLHIVCFLMVFSGFSAAQDIVFRSSSTQSISSDSTSFSFIVWGHPRGEYDRDPPLNIDELVELVHELEPDFVVITGDMINGRIGANPTKELIHEDWDYFDANIKKLGVPVYRLPGNHDVNNFLTRDVYFERYPRLPYSFTYKNSKFILLDSHGIDQRNNDSRRYWGAAATPFEANQINFIKQEMESQDNFAHIFFFMHHTTPWSESDSIWWRDIHPLLVGGKTRAVLSGDTGYLPKGMKFAHIEQDGIHYILNNTFVARTIDVFRKRPKRFHWCNSGQLDNIEYIQVEGDTIQFRTYVLGALSKKNLSWRYWEEVAKVYKSYPPLRRLAILLESTKFNSPKKILFVICTLVGIGFLSGISFVLLVKRYKK